MVGAVEHCGGDDAEDDGVEEEEEVGWPEAREKEVPREGHHEVGEEWK